jgi:hypothetical protein
MLRMFMRVRMQWHPAYRSAGSVQAKSTKTLVQSIKLNIRSKNEFMVIMMFNWQSFIKTFNNHEDNDNLKSVKP